MRHLAVAIACTLILGACGGANEDPAQPGDSGLPAEGTTTATSPASIAEAEPGDQPSATEPSGDQPPATEPSEEEPVGEEKLPEEVPPTTDQPVTGEVSADLMAKIKSDVMARTGAPEADITVVRSEEVIWNDGSLGCPVPGEFYTQAQVSGFWVVLEYAGQTYDYRASDKGHFRLCEGFTTTPSNPTG